MQELLQALLRKFYASLILTTQFQNESLLHSMRRRSMLLLMQTLGLLKQRLDNEKIRIVITDQGPGIPDIEKAMEEGFSTASPQVREMGFGAGMGLSNMKKNSDILNITSETGRGTVVELINFLKSDAR